MLRRCHQNGAIVAALATSACAPSTLLNTSSAQTRQQLRGGGAGGRRPPPLPTAAPTAVTDVAVSPAALIPPRLAIPTRQSHLRLDTRSDWRRRGPTPAAGRDESEQHHITTAEEAIRHNAYNLVMKMLYGKVADARLLEEAHRILGLPPAEELGAMGIASEATHKKMSGALEAALRVLPNRSRKQKGPNAEASLTAACPNIFGSMREAGAFAKSFIQQRKAVWMAYDAAVAKARWDAHVKASSAGTIRRAANADPRRSRPPSPEDEVEMLLAAAVPTYAVAATATVDGARAKKSSGAKVNATVTRRVQPTSNRVEKIVARSAAKGNAALSASEAVLSEVADGSDGVALQAFAARERLCALYAPAPPFAHALAGRTMGAHSSFCDMLTDGGRYFTANKTIAADSFSSASDAGGSPAEELFVAATLASTRSKTLGPARLRALRQQFRRDAPASRYLFAPPGLLVRGYAAARTADGERVVALEPEERWVERCREDAINFERFCLAKVSALSRRGFGGGAGGGLTEEEVAELLISPTSANAADRLNIMNLFLQFRGLPRGATGARSEGRSLASSKHGPRGGRGKRRSSAAVSAALIDEPQGVANAVTALYADAHRAPSDTLPIVDESAHGRTRTAPLRELDAIINAAPPECQLAALGLAGGALSSSHGSSVDAEAAELRKAYQQQAMFLRRGASAYSPSLMLDASSADAAASSAAAAKDLAAEAAAVARSEGVHTFDAVMTLARQQRAKRR